MAATAARVAHLEQELAAHVRLVARLRAGVDAAQALADFDAAQAQAQSHGASQAPSQVQSQSASQPKRRARPSVSESSGVTDGSQELPGEAATGASARPSAPCHPGRSSNMGDGSDRTREAGGGLSVRDHSVDDRRTGDGDRVSPLANAADAASSAAASSGSETANEPAPATTSPAPAPLAYPVALGNATKAAAPLPSSSLVSVPSLTPSSSPCPSPLLEAKQPEALKPSKTLKKDRVALVAKCTEPTPGQTRYWTQSEHDRFLEAVRQHGEKAYVAISNFVETRTPKQVRTHAQKFQMKMARLAKGGALPGGAPPPHTRGSGKAAKIKAAKAKAEAAKAASAAAAEAAAVASTPVPAPVPAKTVTGAVQPVMQAGQSVPGPTDMAAAAPAAAVQGIVPAAGVVSVAPAAATTAAAGISHMSLSATNAAPAPTAIRVPIAVPMCAAPTVAATVLPAAAATAAAVIEADRHVSGGSAAAEGKCVPAASEMVSPLTPHPPAPSPVAAAMPGPLTIVAAVSDEMVEDSEEAAPPTDAAAAVMLLEGMSSDEDMGPEGGDPSAADAYMSYIGGGGRDLEDLEDVAVLATSPFGDGGDEWLNP